MKGYTMVERSAASLGAPTPKPEVAQTRTRGPIAVAGSLILATLVYLSSATGALTQIRAFLGWESDAEGLREMNSAIEALYRPGEGAAAYRYAVDRLVAVARTHRALRSMIAERLADLIRDKTATPERRLIPVERLEMASDAERDSILRAFQISSPADYAFRRLGEAPLANAAPLDDATLDLRGIVVPELRARNMRFSHLDLSGAVFYKSALAGTKFLDCNLTGCVFSASRMERCQIRGGSVRHARFLGAKLDGAAVDGADGADEAPGLPHH